MINWDQVLPNLFASGIAAAGVILNQYWNRRKAKSEQTIRDIQIRAEQSKRHKENQDKLDGILNEQKYLEPHTHTEKVGTLKAHNIVRRKSNGH